MQVHARTAGELTEFGEWCKESGSKVAYFADSFGGLYPPDIAPIVEAISEGFDGPIGCHLHDNMSLAIANTIAALDDGVTWVDSTIRGMGRGPGNARTEYLAVELTRFGLLELDVQPLLELVTDDFADAAGAVRLGDESLLRAVGDQRRPPDLRTEHDHRPSIQRRRHRGVDRATRARRWSQLQHGSRHRGQRNGCRGQPGSWDATGWCEGRSVLIVGPGSSVVERRADIERFIQRSSRWS